MKAPCLLNTNFGVPQNPAQRSVLCRTAVGHSVLAYNNRQMAKEASEFIKGGLLVRAEIREDLVCSLAAKLMDSLYMENAA